MEEENDSKSKASSSVSFSVSPHVGEGGEGDGTAFKSSQGLPYPLCAPVGWRWVLLDGPVDSDWIENLNSVLDDSKVLCLSNGERVDLSPGSRVLFETDDLTNASPATVSRCGVLYMVMDDDEKYWFSSSLCIFFEKGEKKPNLCREHYPQCIRNAQPKHTVYGIYDMCSSAWLTSFFFFFFFSFFLPSVS